MVCFVYAKIFCVEIYFNGFNFGNIEAFLASKQIHLKI